jgi:hypothetical protein
MRTWFKRLWRWLIDGTPMTYEDPVYLSDAWRRDHVYRTGKD